MNLRFAQGTFISALQNETGEIVFTEADIDNYHLIVGWALKIRTESLDA
jgi:hypothetical protein